MLNGKFLFSSVKLKQNTKKIFTLKTFVFYRYSHTAHQSTCTRKCKGTYYIPSLLYVIRLCFFLPFFPPPFSFTQFYNWHPANGAWTSSQAWGGWSTCYKTCGNGQRIRYSVRQCSNPTSKNGGEYCNGTNVQKETEECLLKVCIGK